MTEEHAFSALSKRLGEARLKHPDYARDQYEACDVIEDELQELKKAVLCESRQRQIDEALDVATTAMRFVVGEYQHAR
jgi:hypothetical protein